MAHRPRDGSKIARNADVGIDEWWTDYALYWHQTHGDDSSDEQLGIALARAVKRPTPWSRVTIGRFFRKDGERITSAEIADALRALYPDLPPYLVRPGDLQEAHELAAVHRRAVERRAAAASRADQAVDAILGRAVERVGKSSTPDPSQPRRQGDARTSPDAEPPITVTRRKRGRPRRVGPGRA